LTSADPRRAAWPLLLLLSLAPAAARGDDNHYQSFLIGERAVGLGGAFVAISDDASGAYYNPAGLAEAEHGSVSLSASIYGYAGASYGISAASFESSSRSFISYPTTAAWIQRVRRGRPDGTHRVQLALSLVTPQSDVMRKRIAFVSGNAQQLADNVLVTIAEDDTLWVGLSAAWKVWRHLSIGATIYTTIRAGVHQLYVTTVSHALQNGVEVDRVAAAGREEIKLSHYGLLGVIGVVAPITSRLRLGASFRTPSLELRGRADVSQIQSPQDASGGFSLTSTEWRDVTFHDRQPFKASLGAAYIAPRRFGASVDVSIYGPVDEHPLFESSTPLPGTVPRMRKQLVWQLNVGGEYYPIRALPLRLGFFTDRSSLARMDDCDSAGACTQHENLLTDGVDLYGFAGSIGYEMDRTTLTLACSYSFGAHDSTYGGVTLRTQRSFLLLGIGGSFRF
jgi:hypothetical protein